jgi:hypothetical protein
MEIGGLPVVDAGATALLAMVVMMVLTGRLVPRRVVKDIETERDYWRAAAQERSIQLTRLLNAADTSTKAIEAMTRAAHEEHLP